MAKVAERYFKVDPWRIIEEGFDPERGRIAESVFSLANEFMGCRGYFEEGYSGDGLIGHYVNGLSEQMDIQHPQVFKGLQTVRGFGVNTVDWLHARITLDGETLDLNASKFSDFVRTLDMRSGVMTRGFVWHVGDKQLKLTFTRVLSMRRRNVGAQRISLEPLNFSGEVEFLAGLDFSVPHEIAAGWTQVKTDGKREGRNFWTVQGGDICDESASMMLAAQTQRTRQWLAAGTRVHGLDSPRKVEGEKFLGLKSEVPLTEGEVTNVDRVCVFHWERDGGKPLEAVRDDWMAVVKQHEGLAFDTILAEQKDYWAERWQTLDIELDGKDDLQQGTRFGLFQMYSTYQGRDPSINIPCKGMTAEVYYGWMFWDSETYVLPAYVFIDPAAARSLLEYRYIYLPEARQRAKELGCEGARFPFATIDGTECCGTWQHCDLEVHVNVGITYALWLYERLTGDTAFLHEMGAEVLFEVCRHMASRGEWSPSGDWGVYGCMGPDEFHTMVNHNCYTNFLCRKTFQYAAEVLEQMSADAPEQLTAVREKIGLTDDETAEWARIAENVRIPYDADRNLYEQHAGYFDLPEVDVKNLPPEQIPIYANWVYEKIFRYNMIKQPDLLLLFLFYSTEFDLETKRTNFEYYEERSIHESSLSPGVHSILAAEVGKMDMAKDFFRYMARLDLDNYNRNTEQGLHITAMSGVRLNAVNGFGGLRTDGPRLSFAPSLPEGWNGLRFRLVYRGRVIQLAIAPQETTFRLVEGQDLDVDVYGRTQTLTQAELIVPMQESV